jgi:hypothetical protein
MVLWLREGGGGGTTRSNNTNAPTLKIIGRHSSAPSLGEEVEEPNKGKCSYGQKVKLAYANQVLTEETV